MKTVVMAAVAVLVIWSLLRKAEVDEIDLSAAKNTDRGKPVPRSVP